MPVPVNLTGIDNPLVGAGGLDGASGFLRSVDGPSGNNVTDLVAAYDEANAGNVWRLMGMVSPDGNHDLFLEIFDGSDANEDCGFNLKSDDAGPILGVINHNGVAKIGFWQNSGGGTTQPAAIAAPSGGAVQDTQARAALVAVLNLLSAAAGGYGLTA